MSGKNQGSGSRILRRILPFLLLVSSVSSFDLLSQLMSQGTTNIKSLVSPELLSKLKGIIPPSSGHTDISQIEKILAKLKPVEGRFDPAVLELLANMDSNTRLGKTPAPPNTIPRRKVTHSPDIDDQTMMMITDESYPFYPATTAAMKEPSSSSPEESSKAPPAKFSSKFRITDASTPSKVSSETPSAGVRFEDPNLRNHRLYETEHERYETYENFTTLDQVEDLIAEESYPHEVIALPPPSSERPPRMPLTSRRPTGNGNHGWGGARPHHHPGGQRRPMNEIPSTSASYEDLLSFESFEEEDSAQHNEREQLKMGSTEKTVSYGHPMGKPTTVLTGHEGHFKPSPVDMSPPVYFEPGQEFYTTTISKKKKKSSKNIPGRRHSNMNDHQHHSNSHDHHHNPKYDSHLDHVAHDDYEKEQPNYQHVVNYMKLQNQPQSSTSPHPMNNHPTPFPNSNPFIPQQTPLPPSPGMMPGLPPPPPQPYFNGLLQSPNMKQDRILHPSTMTGFSQSPSASGQPSSVVYPDPHQYGGPTMKNSYMPAASENVVHDAQLNSFYQPSPNDLAYSAGQNYYHSNHGGGGHHHGGGGGGGGGHHHHPVESSSWSTTFLVLGGLIALSAVIAFFLPSFLTSSAVTGGKDTGDDKNAPQDADLWTEIKGLYTDIVNIAKGDYTHRPNNPNDLPKINIIEVDEDDEPPTTQSPISSQHPQQLTFHKRKGSEPAKHSSEENTSFASAQDVQDDEAAMDIMLKRPEKPKKKKTVNINDTIAFGVYRDPNMAKSHNGLNFANAFNQTLNAWEKVPLLAN